MNTEKIIELFELYIDRKATPEQKVTLQEWIRNNSTLNEWLVNEVSASKETLDPTISKAMLEKIYHEIQPRTKTRILVRSVIMRYVALFILPLLTASIIYVVIHRQQEANFSKASEMVSEIVVERGQKAQLTLPDGTKVWLNSDTQLSYPANFNDRDRRVKLSGEAYFEVHKDQERPFEVEAEALTVRVLGTAFNIRAYRDDRYITSTLVYGKTEAVTPNGAFIQQPNQAVIYDKIAHTTRKLEVDDADNYACWRLNGLFFDNERLDDIAIRLQRLYNIEIHITDESLKALRFTGNMPNGNTSLEIVLQFITISANLSYSFEDNKVVILR